MAYGDMPNNSGNIFDPNWWAGQNSFLGQVSGALNGTTAQNSAAQANAQAQMNFQAQQTSTQYQRGVADLKAAGLNPILAAGGSTDAAAAGASAPVAANNVGGTIVGGIQNMLNSAIDVGNYLNSSQTTDAQIALTKAQTLGTLANTAKNQALEPIWDNLGKIIGPLANSIGGFLTGKGISGALNSAKAGLDSTVNGITSNIKSGVNNLHNMTRSPGGDSGGSGW